MQIKIIFPLLVLVSFLLSCNNDKVAPPKQINAEKLKKPLEKANVHMVKVENEEIEDYIRRHEWSMITTGTGLRYLIYKNGQGIKAISGDVVKINYKVNLINGVDCYSSKDDGPLEFATDKADVINGLEEAILLMREGDKAKVIIPSHLAYGLLGYEKKVPKRATLIYDIEVLKVMKPKPQK